MRYEPAGTRLPPVFYKIALTGNIRPMNKIFRKFLSGVLQGLRQALVIAPQRAYVLPAPNAFAVDATRLRTDARKIGDDLNGEFRE